MVSTAQTRQNMPFRTVLAAWADKSDNSSGFPTLFRRHPLLHARPLVWLYDLRGILHNKKDVKSGINNSWLHILNSNHTSIESALFLYIEPEQDHISVLNNIVLALNSHKSFLAGS